MGDAPRFLLHPRGYVRVTDAMLTPTKLSTLVQGDGYRFVKEPEVVPGNEDIDNLYRAYISRTVNTDSWHFRKRVIAAAARLFGDFKTWVTIQARFNDYLYDLNFDFLLDTWQFIRTGERDMSPLTWQELLLEHAKPRPGVGTLDRLSKFDWDNIKSEEIIGLWCSRDNGFGDMLCTLHVLFGVARIPLAQQTTA